jgi:F-type H+-transporting ATPase subunit delta
MQSTLTARYARALADAVREKAALERTAEELETLSRVFLDSKPLRDFLLNPGLPEDRKLKALGAIAGKAGLSATTGRLLEILLRKGRMGILPDLSDEFRRIEERVLNRVSVEVTTAVPLSPALRKKLAESLERFTGKSVRLEARSDPSVLGGARARIGSVVYDGTIAGKLQKLKQQLIGER